MPCLWAATQWGFDVYRPFLCLLVVSGILSFTLPAYAAETFHPAQTEAEKLLDRLLLFDREDDSIYNVVMGKADPNAPSVEKYSPFFTGALLRAIQEKNSAFIQKRCGGQETDFGCGIDVHLISCTQDFPEAYLYTTLKSSKKSAFVTYLWASDEQPSKLIIQKNLPEQPPIYRFIQDKKDWKMDGIDCGGENKFNMP